MILDTTTKTLEIVLAEAMVTHNCDITTSYADQAVSGFLPASSDTVSNGVTPVTAVAAPAASVVRNAREVRLHNNDTVMHTVTLQLNDNGTRRVVLSGVVLPGGNFLYTPDSPDASLSEWNAGTVTSIDANSFQLTSGTLGLADNIIVPGGNVSAPSAVAASNAAGTDANLNGGTGDGSGAGGAAQGIAGNGGVTGVGGDAGFFAGNGGATSGNGGEVLFHAGNAPGTGDGGGFVSQAGDAFIAGNGGGVLIASGAGIGAGKVSGDLILQIGTVTGGATPGNVKMPVLPTADPGITGALWVDPATHILHVSP